MDSNWRYGEPSMLIPSVRLGEGKWGEMLKALKDFSCNMG